MTDQHTTVQYQLRLPEELRDRIKNSGKEHNRSMNADIVARLEQTFAEEVQPVPMEVMFDDDWLAGSGLTKAEFGAFVKMAVQSGVSQYKVDKDD